MEVPVQTRPQQVAATEVVVLPAEVMVAVTLHSTCCSEQVEPHVDPMAQHRTLDRSFGFTMQLRNVSHKQRETRASSRLWQAIWTVRCHFPPPPPPPNRELTMCYRYSMTKHQLGQCHCLRVREKNKPESVHKSVAYIGVSRRPGGRVLTRMTSRIARRLASGQRFERRGIEKVPRRQGRLRDGRETLLKSRCGGRKQQPPSRERGEGQMMHLDKAERI